ncbi:hypothetical protein [Pseudomonas sp. dw_358]|uniref:hypothetical protein n=1 Tax=Pseudomonas sp. dw_358 TaxID=2720083 RepID=UPI001BD37CA6|nr:hypothetical protein [Pseudomonas sp. dw_358]
MSLRCMRAELKRIAERIGADDEDVVLILLAVVNGRKEDLSAQMGYPATAGHSLSYPVQGMPEAFYFPLHLMSSDEAARLAEAFILHVRKVERLRRPMPIGVMDMAPLPYARATLFPPLQDGADIEAHVAEQYQEIIHSRASELPV